MRLATAHSDKTAKVWDAVSGQELMTLRGHSGAVSGVAFSPDGLRLATASDDMTAKVWNAVSGQGLVTLRGHSHIVSGVAFSPNGKRLAIASWDNTAKVCLANCYGRADFSGAAQVNWLSLSERIRWQ